MSDLRIRRYEDRDEPAVLELLATSLGAGPAGGRSAEFFRWKHVENPFGRSFMLVGESDGRPVGLRAFMRWRFLAGDRRVAAVRAVDTATHPEAQGRGVFSALTVEALSGMRGEVDLVFNTPNERSGPGYLKMGWRRVGRAPVRLRVRRPIRFLRDASSLRGAPAAEGGPPEVEAEPVAAALGDDRGLSSLLSSARERDRRLRTDADPSYLRWRYAAPPGLRYHAVRDERAGELRGMAIFRVRPRGRLWESAVAEVIVPAGDRATAARLLRAVGRAAPTDHLTALFPSGGAAARAGRWLGFFPSPVGPTLMVNPLREGLEPDPTMAGSWAVSLGDLEVF